MARLDLTRRDVTRPDMTRLGETGPDAARQDTMFL